MDQLLSLGIQIWQQLGFKLDNSWALLNVWVRVLGISHLVNGWSLWTPSCPNATLARRFEYALFCNCSNATLARRFKYSLFCNHSIYRVCNCPNATLARRFKYVLENNNQTPAVVENSHSQWSFILEKMTNTKRTFWTVLYTSKLIYIHKKEKRDYHRFTRDMVVRQQHKHNT